jgi:voltage-gated potassium channel
VVSLGSFTTTIIAREALSKGTSSVLMRIVNDSKVSLVKAEGYVGLRFIEVVEKLKTTENRLIIGVVRGSDILINPSNDLIIQPSDLLITVS